MSPIENVTPVDAPNLGLAETSQNALVAKSSEGDAKPKLINVAEGPASLIRPKGEESREAVVGWMKNELSKGTERAYDLGKFLFTVSIGTAGLVATLMKDAQWPALFVGAIFMNAPSAIAALQLAWPKLWKLESKDLRAQYNSAMAKNFVDLKWWARFYGVAFVVSVIAIVTRR